MQQAVESNQLKIAALTMVYNEADFLPIWMNYYRNLVGANNCYVVDHGSDDGSTDHVEKKQLFHVNRSPHDDVKRVQIIADITEQLLTIYDVVVHTDVDEVVFPDPRMYKSMSAYCEANSQEVITAYGFELLHVRYLEKCLDVEAPILSQRQWARFTSPMCKPTLIRRTPNWSPGFHSSADAVTFADLFLFHLRWVDFDLGLKRLQRTRSQPWADSKAGLWQRVSDEEYEKLFHDITNVEHNEGCSFYSFDPLLKNAADLVVASQVGREQATYRISLDIWASEAWRVPKAFKSIF